MSKHSFDAPAAFAGRGPLEGPAGTPRAGTTARELTYPGKISHEVEIPFHDCDPLGVAWHGRYMEYMEAARRRLFEAHGLGVFDMVHLKLRMFVSDTRCRYNSPLRYGDTTEVTCWFTDAAPLVRVAYTIHNLTTGRLAARAYTVMAMTDDAGKFLPELPVEVVDRLRLPS